VRDLYWTCAFIFVALLLYRFRGVWLSALKRFDERNVARLEQEQRDKADPVAHFRHTLSVAGEQVEEVQEIVEPDERTGVCRRHWRQGGMTIDFTKACHPRASGDPRERRTWVLK
jgi:hypothetical protein